MSEKSKSNDTFQTNASESMQSPAPNYVQDLSVDEVLKDASGAISYGMTNDYMFHAVLQESDEGLRHFLSALLDIPYEDITDCQILNPIILGRSIDDKSCILDIRLELNHEKLIDLEMQVGNLTHWPKRTLFYLSRLYCNIKSGQDYKDIKPALHIGILTQSPFKDIQEFYSEYQMANLANGHVFSRHYSARVLDLSQIDNVSEEQKQTELYYWARLFVATTWEEIKMLVKDRKYLQSAVTHLRQLTEEEKIQLQCEARERYNMDMSSSRSDGIEEGMERTNKLNRILLNEGRIEDLERSTLDLEYQKKLFQKYGI